MGNKKPSTAVLESDVKVTIGDETFYIRELSTKVRSRANVINQVNRLVRRLPGNPPALGSSQYQRLEIHPHTRVFLLLKIEGTTETLASMLSCSDIYTLHGVETLVTDLATSDEFGYGCGFEDVLWKHAEARIPQESTGMRALNDSPAFAT